MIAIAQHVGFGRRAPARGVERKTGDHVVRLGQRQPAFVGDEAEGVESGIGGRLFLEGALGEDAQRLHPVLGVFQIALVAQRAALVLIVGNIVAAAAPGIEQPAALARGPVEQLRGSGEAVRALLDRLERFVDQHRAIAATPGAGRGGTQIARLDEGARLAQRSSAFIWKIGVCGSYDAILSISPASAVSCTRIF